jgi:MFS family permease
MKNIKIKELYLKNFFLLWSGQSLSQLGSSMTGFALIIWAYKQQGTVMSIALLSVFSYLPCILISLFAGPIIDRFQKKKIMLICDTVAAMCTLFAFAAICFGILQVWHLYFINAVSGAMNAFQSPVSKVVITLIVPKEHYVRVSGLRSLSDSIISVFNPVLATTIMSFYGIETVFVIDLLTFFIAFLSLLFLINIPKSTTPVGSFTGSNLIKESLQGFDYLKKNIGFLYLMLFMAGINFLAAMAFFSVLPAMVLSRSSGNEQILGLVNGAIGVGGIVGSILVTIIKPTKNKVKTIFVSAALSFLLCDIFLGIGRNPYIWILAAFAGNLPIPFLNAAENSLLQTKIPTDILGRIFSIRGSVQFITLPIGYLAGGFLADRVFEPLMHNSVKAQSLLGYIVGSGKGSGMALIFVITGVTGFALSIISSKNRYIRELDI